MQNFSVVNSRCVLSTGRSDCGVCSLPLLCFIVSHLVFCKRIIRVINILFVTNELCITLIMSVCVASRSWTHIR
jgi:hypothetical protein